jgi:capsular polysaccharide biosynthesis protein
LTNRRPANEAEREQLCVQRGVRPVVSERLPFREQVALFWSARTIVATHGAGLANLVFAEPGGRLLELFLPELFNECYAHVAVLRGLRYEPFYCSGVDNSTSVAPLAEIAAALGRS